MRPPSTLLQYDRFLVAVAHPDDAEFSSAGTIARLTEAGKHVVIAQVTSGAKGTSDPSEPQSEMIAIREAEERESARRLGVAEVDFLHQTDGELLPTLELRGIMVRAIRTHRPDVIITHDPFRPYAFHPDHRSVGLSTFDAAYPSARDPHAFPEHLGEGLEPHKTAELWLFNAEFPDLYVDITVVIERKFDSLRAHVSQLPDPDGTFVRVLERAVELAQDQPFELAEAFKVVEMRR